MKGTQAAGAPQQGGPVRRLAYDAAVTMGLILVSRLLGFVRERAVAEVFGRNAQTDAFNAAFNIPDLMYLLLVGGAITAAFIPVFSEYLARGEAREGWVVASTFLNVTGVLLLVLTGLGILFAPWLAPLVAYGFVGTQRDMLVDLMRWMFPAVFCTALAGLGMGVLNTYRHFTTPMMGPIVYNTAIILGAYGLGPRMGIHGMAVGTVAGAAANAILQWTLVYRRYPGWRPVLEVRHPGVRRLAWLMLPAVVGLSVTQLSLIIGTNLASGLPAGSITALRLSNRVMQFPLGVFAMGMSTVLFPTLARQAALGQWGLFSRTLDRGLRGVLLLTVPSAVGLAVIARPVVRLLFQAGQFGDVDTGVTAYALVFYAGGLVSQSAIQLLTRAFYSMQDVRTPVRISILSLVLNTVLSLAFLRWTGMQHGGLALAFTLASLISWAIYMRVLFRRLAGWRRREAGLFLGRVGLACIPMALVAIAVAAAAERLWGSATMGARALQVLLAAGAGGAAYALAGWLMGLEEIGRLVGGIVRRLHGMSRLVRGAPKAP